MGQRGGVGWQRGIGFGGTECPCVGDSERLGRRIHGMGFLVCGSAYNGSVGSGFAAWSAVVLMARWVVINSPWALAFFCTVMRRGNGEHWGSVVSANLGMVRHWNDYRTSAIDGKGHGGNAWEGAGVSQWQ